MKKSFNPILYHKISINDLILFSMLSIIKKQEKCGFERLVKECFSLFPEIFSFDKYPLWPDARKLDRSLRTLRKKKLIIGDPTTHFSLTKTGRKTAEEVAKTFGQRELFEFK